MYSGMPMTNTVNPGSPFGPAAYVTGGSSVAPSSLMSQTPMYQGHTALTDRPANIDINLQPYMPIYGPNVRALYQACLNK